MRISRMFSIFVLVVLSSFLYSMGFDPLPNDITDNIVVHWAQTIGTPAIKNIKDIPVIMAYVRDVSLTSKKLYQKIHNAETSSLFIGTLLNRFGVDGLENIQKINMPGTQNYIKKYLTDTGDYPAFKQLQRIFEITREECEEFAKHGFNLKDRQKYYFDKKDYNCDIYSQTKQGFFIKAGGMLGSICTPWGEASLFQTFPGDPLIHKAFYQAFLKRFETSFFCITQENQNCSRCYELVQDQQSEALVPDAIDLKELIFSGDKKRLSEYRFFLNNISKEEVKRQEGKEKLIFTEWCSSLYKLHTIDGCQLPEPEMLPGEAHRNYSSMETVWKIMHNLYNKEKGIEIVAKLEIDTVKHKRQASDKPERKTCITSIETVSDLCANFIKQLENQPVEGSGREECKVLSFESHIDYHVVCTLLTNVVQKLRNNKTNNIYHFTSQQQVKYGCGAYGLEQKINDDKPLEEWSFEGLKADFDTCLSAMQTGWKQTILIENMDILDKIDTKSEEEWSFFMKEKKLIDEDFLIKIFGDAFGLDPFRNGKIVCFYLSSNIYLWIKKDAFDQVVKALNLQFDIGELL